VDQASNKLSIEERLDRLEAQNRYLNDYIAIWKLQSLYCHYINIGAVQAIVELFADSPEVELELSNKGILKGRDAPCGSARASPTFPSTKSSPSRGPGAGESTMSNISSSVTRGKSSRSAGVRSYSHVTTRVG
jgi:hypothetical protein